MRIISGTARSRKIQAPPGNSTRPITDRAKEGIFNMLGSLGGVQDAEVLDLFAGAGSFGLECISRGAAHVTFVERNQAALRTLRANIETLGFQAHATVVAGSVEAALAGRANTGRVDLAFCDPPYADDPWEQLLGMVRTELLVAHAERPVTLPSDWEEIKRRQYGRPHILIARPRLGSTEERTESVTEDHANH